MTPLGDEHAPIAPLRCADQIGIRSLREALGLDKREDALVRRNSKNPQSALKSPLSP